MPEDIDSISRPRLGYSGLIGQPRQSLFFDFDDRQEVRLNLSWVLNSVDEPVFPTEGRTLEAGLAFSSLRADLVSGGLSPEPDIQAPLSSRELGVELRGARYYPVTGSQTLSAKAHVFLGASRIENVPSAQGLLLTDDLGVWRSSLELGYAKVLKSTRKRRWRDLRWENDLELVYGGTSPDFGQPENPLGGFRVGSGIAYRNKFGVFRFKLNYLNLRGR